MTANAQAQGPSPKTIRQNLAFGVWYSKNADRIPFNSRGVQNRSLGDGPRLRISSQATHNCHQSPAPVGCGSPPCGMTLHRLAPVRWSGSTGVCCDALPPLHHNIPRVGICPSAATAGFLMTASISLAGDIASIPGFPFVVALYPLMEDILPGHRPPGRMPCPSPRN